MLEFKQFVQAAAEQDERRADEAENEAENEADRCCLSQEQEIENPTDPQ